MSWMNMVWVRIVNAVRYYCVEVPKSTRLMKTSGFDVMSPLETIEYVCRTGCSVSRFGDGEFALAFKGSIGFQTESSSLQSELRDVLVVPSPKLLVCLPYSFTYDGMARLVPKAARGWRRFAIEYIPRISQLMASRKDLDKVVKFGDSLISRPYMIFKDRNFHATSVFEALQRLWMNKDVLIVEGDKTRLGVGNDLFACARHVRRILCPAFNAYDRIEEIESKTYKYAAGSIVLLALGPTATVLAARLARLGIQAIDIGHVDVEYAWFKMGVDQKVPIPGKYVHEAQCSSKLIEQCDDAEYLSSIIDTVK